MLRTCMVILPREILLLQSFFQAVQDKNQAHLISMQVNYMLITLVSGLQLTAGCFENFNFVPVECHGKHQLLKIQNTVALQDMLMIKFLSFTVFPFFHVVDILNYQDIKLHCAHDSTHEALPWNETSCLLLNAHRLKYIYTTKLKTMKYCGHPMGSRVP